MLDAAKPFFTGSAKSLAALALAPIIMFTGVGGAAAQSVCDCQIAAGAGGVVGTVTQATGTVLFSGVGGLVAVSTGAGLSSGDALSTGPTSSATVTFENDCTINLGANAQMTITPQGAGLCAATTDNIAGTVIGNGGVGGAVVAAAAAGGAVIVALGLADPVSD